MTTLTRHSPGAIRPAIDPVERRISLPPLPTPPARAGLTGMMAALPMLGGLGGVGLLALGPRSLLSYVLVGAMVAIPVLLTVLMVVTGRRRTNAERTRRLSFFLDAVAAARTTARDDLLAARAAAHTGHPAPGVGSRTGSWRVVRAGTMSAPTGIVIDAGEPAAEVVPEPLAVVAVAGLQADAAVLPGVPAVIDLSGRMSVDGPPGLARRWTRALLLQAAAAASADELAVGVVTTDPQRWAWLRWLPHASSTTYADAHGPARLIAESSLKLQTLLEGDEREVLVVIDVDGDDEPIPATATGIRITGDRPTLGVDPDLWRIGDAGLVGPGGAQITPDLLSAGTADLGARRLLAGARPGAGRTRCDLPAWLGLRDAGAVPLGPGVRRYRGDSDFLSVPFAATPSGEPVRLDLKESALGGVGPHGLLIGATGSGKSELLRSLVIGLLATHHPDDLQLLLVDFKGGSSFVGVEDAPAVAGLITNLQGDSALIDRIRESLTGELERRQRLLRDSSGCRDITEYAAVRQRTGLPPLPELVIVIDEFSELLAAQPEVIDLLVQIGRVGRSLGVHLLLAAQRIDEGRLRGLDSHLSYRLCLRTFGAEQSRAVIGEPDASTLPAEPGHGFLRDASGLTRFRAVLASVRWSSAERAPADAGPVLSRMPLVNGPVRRTLTPTHLGRPLDESVCAAVVAVQSGVSPLWLPPLADPPTLDQVCGGPRSGFGACIGWVDRPRAQEIAPLSIDLSGSGGHVAIVGGPRSGKSVAAAALAAALALGHGPDALQILAIDHSRGALADLAGLPQVGVIAPGEDEEMVDRVLGYVADVLRGRESGRPSPMRILLVIDGLAAFRQRYERYDPLLLEIATRGLALGVHLVATASRWLDIRPALRDQLGTRLELRLGDPLDSVHGRAVASAVPTGRPGRCLAPSGEHALIALPRVDGVRRSADLAEGGRALAAQVAADWPDGHAAAFRRLPSVIRLAQLPPEALRDALVVGVEARHWSAVTLTDARPLLMIVGERSSGRSAALRAIGRQQSHRSADAGFCVVDPRGGLADLASLPGCRGYARTVVEGDALVAGLSADTVLLIDDYDLIGGMRALTGLADLLPQAGALGVRVVLARDCASGGRLMIDPVLAAMEERGARTVLLSGRPEHGAVRGTLPRPAPPGRGRLLDGGGFPVGVQLLAEPPQ